MISKRHHIWKDIPLTVAQFYYVYGDARVEIVDGEVIDLMPHVREVAEIYGNLYCALKPYLAEHDLGAAWMQMPYVLRADKDTDILRDFRQPDLSFVAKARNIEHDAVYGIDGPYRLAPDFVVEIISTLDSHDDVMTKKDDYLRYGVRLVWIIDPTYARSQAIHPTIPKAPCSTTAILSQVSPCYRGGRLH
jgi:Uma2 family endonuclease